MKAFNQYSDSELLTLDNQQITDSIRIESINRGVTPPLELPEALKRSEWKGYTPPSEPLRVYKVKCGYSSSDCGYLTQERAEQALVGLVRVEKLYNSDRWKILDTEPAVECVVAGSSPTSAAYAKFQELCQDDTEFNKIRDECIKRLSEVRQSDYDRRVNAERKAEYLRLAQGNEEIAKGFWSRTQGATPWPSE